jgi:FkbM family methyltransferase
MKKTVLFLILVGISVCFMAHAEQVAKEFIAQFLPKNPIVIDAGAYNGNDSSEMCALWPEGKIYAFEPVPHIFQQLINNTQKFKNIECFQKALSDKIGIEHMYVSSGGDQSSSLLRPTGHLYHFPHITFHRKVDVETTTLDIWAQEQGLDHIDLLWFDLQGVELKVLQASPKIFETVKVVYTEVNYTNLYENMPLAHELKKWMESQGFVAVKEVMHHSTFGDVLFVRKELIQ